MSLPQGSSSKDELIYNRKSLVQSLIDENFKALLIGLQYVIEIQNENQTDLEKVNFICSICSMKLNSKSFVPHIRSVPHRMNYAEIYYPEIHAKFKEIQYKEWNQDKLKEFFMSLKTAVGGFKNLPKKVAVCTEEEKVGVIAHLTEQKKKVPKNTTERNPVVKPKADSSKNSSRSQSQTSDSTNNAKKSSQGEANKERAQDSTSVKNSGRDRGDKESDRDKEKNRDREKKNSDRDRDRRDRDRTRDRDRDKDKNRDKDRENRGRSKDQNNDRARSRDQTNDRARSRDQTNDRARSRDQTNDRARSRDQTNDRGRSRDLNHDRDRSRDHRDGDRSRNRGRDRDFGRNRGDRNRFEDKNNFGNESMDDHGNNTWRDRPFNNRQNDDSRSQDWDSQNSGSLFSRGRGLNDDLPNLLWNSNSLAQLTNIFKNNTDPPSGMGAFGNDKGPNRWDNFNNSNDQENLNEFIQPNTNFSSRGFNDKGRGFGRGSFGDRGRGNRGWGNWANDNQNNFENDSRDGNREYANNDRGRGGRGAFGDRGRGRGFFNERGRGGFKDKRGWSIENQTQDNYNEQQGYENDEVNNQDTGLEHGRNFANRGRWGEFGNRGRGGDFNNRGRGGDFSGRGRGNDFSGRGRRNEFGNRGRGNEFGNRGRGKEFGGRGRGSGFNNRYRDNEFENRGSNFNSETDRNFQENENEQELSWDNMGALMNDDTRGSKRFNEESDMETGEQSNNKRFNDGSNTNMKSQFQKGIGGFRGYDNTNTGNSEDCNASFSNTFEPQNAHDDTPNQNFNNWNSSNQGGNENMSNAMHSGNQFNPNMPSNNQPNEVMIEQYKQAETRLEQEHRKMEENYEQNPLSHPAYEEEQSSFYFHKNNEIQSQGINPQQIDLKSEWTNFWNRRLKELCLEDLSRKRDQLMLQYNIRACDLQFYVNPVPKGPGYNSYRPIQPPKWSKANQKDVKLHLKTIQAVEDLLGSHKITFSELMKKVSLTDRPIDVFRDYVNVLAIDLVKQQLTSQILGVKNTMVKTRLEAAVKATISIQNLFILYKNSPEYHAQKPSAEQKASAKSFDLPFGYNPSTKPPEISPKAPVPTKEQQSFNAKWWSESPENSNHSKKGDELFGSNIFTEQVKEASRRHYSEAMSNSTYNSNTTKKIETIPQSSNSNAYSYSTNDIQQNTYGSSHSSYGNNQSWNSTNTTEWNSANNERHTGNHNTAPQQHEADYSGVQSNQYQPQHSSQQDDYYGLDVVHIANVTLNYSAMQVVHYVAQQFEQIGKNPNEEMLRRVLSAISNINRQSSTNAPSNNANGQPQGLANAVSNDTYTHPISTNIQSNNTYVQPQGLANAASNNTYVQLQDSNNSPSNNTYAQHHGSTNYSQNNTYGQLHSSTNVQSNNAYSQPQGSSNVHSNNTYVQLQTNVPSNSTYVQSQSSANIPCNNPIPELDQVMNIQTSLKTGHRRIDSLEVNELRLLLSNFKNIEREQQKMLTSYLKDLEATDPSKLASLRKLMNQRE